MDVTLTLRHTLSAIIYPVCFCGVPWRDHDTSPNSCPAYSPSRPITDLGLLSDVLTPAPLDVKD